MVDLKFGFNVFNFTPEELFEYTCLNNLNHIEINLTLKKSSLDSFTPERISALRSKCIDNGIELSLHLPTHINITDIIPTYRKRDSKYLLKALNLADKLNAKIITAHMGFFFWFPVEKWRRKTALENFVINLERILEQYDGDTCIALENVTPLPVGSDHLLLGDNVEDLKYVFSNISSPLVKFCLDTGHANMSEGIELYLEHFSDKMVIVHFHDNFGNDDEHLPVGKGGINWNQFGKLMNKYQFNGPFISECRDIKPKEASELLLPYLTNQIASPLKS
ncbi:MAG: xylose isomerase [Melioribacteraceae bacterium]|nr:MAG: xylose isomerase [Melioribacteraceae bacterium]